MDIKQEVIDRYRLELAGEMDRTQFETLVLAETERLEVRAAQLHPDQRMRLDQAWQQRHPGQAMTFRDQLEHEQQARQMTLEIVLAELREPMGQDQPTQSDQPSVISSAMDRWLTDEAEAATPQMQALAELVWPQETPEFQVWAEELLQARAEDGLALPTGPADQPLVNKLSAMVHQALADQARSDALRADARK